MNNRFILSKISTCSLQHMPPPCVPHHKGCQTPRFSQTNHTTHSRSARFHFLSLLVTAARFKGGRPNRIRFHRRRLHPSHHQEAFEPRQSLACHFRSLPRSSFRAPKPLCTPKQQDTRLTPDPPRILIQRSHIKGVAYSRSNRPKERGGRGREC